MSKQLLQQSPRSQTCGKELSKQFNPDRYEHVEKEIKDFFDGPKFLSIMEEINEIHDKKLDLNGEQYNRLNIQLAFLTVLQNGQRAELANILKRQDLFTQARHSELPGMWTFQLNK